MGRYLETGPPLLPPARSRIGGDPLVGPSSVFLRPLLCQRAAPLLSSAVG